jgi:hypothetical protein
MAIRSNQLLRLHSLYISVQEITYRTICDIMHIDNISNTEIIEVSVTCYLWLFFIDQHV